MAFRPKSTILLGATALALGTTLIGCTPDGGTPVNTVARASALLDKASREAANAATVALARGDTAKAVALAERAVGFSPRDAGYRSLLANAYIKAGRFSSAQVGFSEVLLLNPSDGRAALSRALTQIALGDREGAVATLQGSNGQISTADHGLALALAGDPTAAIAMLQPAAREAGADARVRQNLALAHALAGQWEQARIIAAQDVPANELSARMASWAEFARPDNAIAQVPTLLGVAPVQDEGRPARLALVVEPAQANVALAAAAPVSTPVVVADLAPPLAEQTVAVASVVEEVAPAAPVMAEMVQPAAIAPAQASPSAQHVAAMSILAAAPVVAVKPRIPAVRVAPKPRAMNGRFAVQLGAFSSRARVEHAWAGALRRHRALGAFLPSSTAFNGRAGTVHRLSVSGFGTQRQAAQVCTEVRRGGGSCFVRTVAGDQPIRWAGRATRNG